jgi:hypothetical protein
MMRAWMSFAALALILTLASRASAQTAVSFGGASPTQLINQPIPATGNISTMPLFDHSKNLTQWFPSKLAIPSSKRVIGQSIFPTNQADWLKAFGFQPAQNSRPRFGILFF